MRPDHAEKFGSLLPAGAVTGGHLRGKRMPSFVSEEGTRGFDCRLFSVSAEAALVDFELPDEAVEYFPWCADDPGERWWLSMQCFNDPCSAAAPARGTEITPYPLPLLLAIIVLTQEGYGDLDTTVKIWIRL
jgi:hypothetical protein